MSVVVVNAGEERFLDLVLAEGYTLGLYKNDVTAGLTPDEIDALAIGDFTAATFPGYSALPLTGGAWTTTASTPSVASYAPQTFTCDNDSANESIYGYMVTETSGGALRWFEQFAAPVLIDLSGDAIVVTPRITLDDQEGNMVPTGMIAPFAAATAPTGWLLCDGTAVSRTTYADLYAVMGDTYGNGDGSTTFNVPDMRQRFPLGKATSGTGATLGGTGGDIDHVHDLDTASSHARIIASGGSPAGVFIVRRSGLPSVASTHKFTADNMANPADTTAHTVWTQLGGDSDSGNPPYQVTQFIVKV